MTEAAAQAEESLKDRAPERRSSRLMIDLSAGHGVKHFYQQGVLLLIPSIRETLGLSDVGVGLIETARTISSAAGNIPAGIMADMYRSKVSLMLASSLACMALGYLLMGASPGYWLLLIGVAITGGGTCLWHAPAFGTLAAVYPERRALAMSVHRMGGSVGDSVSPIAMGVLLGGFAFWGLRWGGMGWRVLALALVIPALLSAAAALLTFRKMEGAGRGTPGLREYVRSARPLLTNTGVLGMVTLSGIRAMAHRGLNVFLVIYMAEDLGFPPFKVGYHVALLTLFGVVFGPLIGLASDRIGRRPVMFLGLSAIAVLVFFLLPFGTGWSFTVIIACLGVFLYSINPVMMATALDAVKKGTEGSGVAVMFTGSAVFGAFSPLIAGRLKEGFGMDGVFYYTAIIVAISALASLFVPMARSSERVG